MLFDLHVHSRISPCSILTVAQIVERARAVGLDGVCITDHNTTALRRQIGEGVRADGLCLLVGMEYDTPDGDFLLFGAADHLPRGLAGAPLLDLVARQGGMAVAAHPGRAGRGLREDLLWDRSCTILETLNGRNSDAENYRAEVLRRMAGVAGCGGSDAHAPEEIGRAATRFHAPIRSMAELVAALKGGGFSPEIPRQKAHPREVEMLPPDFAAAAAR